VSIPLRCFPHIRVHVKYSLFLSYFNETLIFSKDFRKIPISDFMKIRPVGAELFRADRQTNRMADITKLIVAFRNSATPPIEAAVLRTSCEV